MRGWGLLILVACPIDSEEDYARRRAEAECALAERCDQGFFESEYTSRDDCVDHQVEMLTGVEEYYGFSPDSECTFVPRHAGLCVSRIRRMSCEEWADGDSYFACDLVYDCGFFSDTGYFGYYE
jgi:hypothetical protein